ncbi:hypothetical protein ANO14919_109700 [Xylariales sp. No.14919]|nr:hypothetical protein ANO14919_109700 [Xylariales sp. No.14919]
MYEWHFWRNQAAVLSPCFSVGKNRYFVRLDGPASVAFMGFDLLDFTLLYAYLPHSRFGSLVRKITSLADIQTQETCWAVELAPHVVNVPGTFNQETRRIDHQWDTHTQSRLICLSSPIVHIVIIRLEPQRNTMSLFLEIASNLSHINVVLIKTRPLLILD